MSELEQLNLTNEDFKLIEDGLEALPDSGSAGEMMTDLLGGMLTKDDSEAKRKFETDRENRRFKKMKEKEILVENIRILQGKIIAFKRYLQQNNLLSVAIDQIQ